MLLHVVHRPDGAPAGTALLAIDPLGSTIGRAPECDLVLDDPLRFVSRRHVWIAPEGMGAARLRCISNTAMILVNGEPLPPQGERLVRGGDRLQVGGYELALEIAESDTNTATVPVKAAAGGREGEPAPRSAEDLVAAPPSELAAAAAPAAFAPAGFVPSAAHGLLPPSQPQPPAEAVPTRRPARLDRWFDLDSAADPLGPGSPLPALDAGPPPVLPPAAMAPPPWSTFDAPPPAALAPAPVEPPRVPSFDAGAHRRVDAATSPDAAARRAAFLLGAGLDPATPIAPESAAGLERLGRLLRTAVDGTLELLRSRAATKRRIGAGSTHITPLDNNLLKFTPDAGEALKLLLAAESRPGFLPPVDALREAYRELALHEAGLAAGTRAAVADLLARLSPATLEAAEGQQRGLARWLPVLREAALWRRHRQEHARLQQQLEASADAVFGREFLQAYHAQTPAVAAARRGPRVDEGSGRGA